MEQCHSRSRRSLFELAMYRITILGTLDKNWSEDYGSMTIEHTNDPHDGSMTIITGC